MHECVGEALQSMTRVGMDTEGGALHVDGPHDEVRGQQAIEPNDKEGLDNDCEALCDKSVIDLKAGQSDIYLIADGNTVEVPSEGVRWRDA